MATKGGFDMDAAYESFLMEEANSGMGGFNVFDKQGVAELRENAKMDFTTFSEAVKAGSYYGLTSQGVNYEDPRFKDKNFDYNAMAPYTTQFMEAVDKPEAKNFAVTSEGVVGGTKTHANFVVKNIKTQIEDGSPELIDAATGKQFDVKTDEKYDGGAVGVVLDRTMIEGRPTFLVTYQQNAGSVKVPVTKRVTVPSDSGMMNDVEQMAVNMMNSTYGGQAKQKEARENGGYIYGSLRYPKVGDTDLNILATNKEHVIKTGSGLEIIVTPKMFDGRKSYEAKLRVNGQEDTILPNQLIFDKKADILTALGLKRFNAEQGR